MSNESYEIWTNSEFQTNLRLCSTVSNSAALASVTGVSSREKGRWVRETAENAYEGLC